MKVNLVKIEMILDTVKLIGILFHQKMTKHELVDIVTALHEEGVLSLPTLNAVLELDEDILISDFTELFEGVGDMKTPPWGSVYLDRERVLFGESTLEYRQFLSDQGVDLNTGIREPEDQFGLMLLAYAFLLESGNVKAADKLMTSHLLPWGMVYLSLLNKVSHNQFYSELAQDILFWLQKLMGERGYIIEEKKIYLNE